MEPVYLLVLLALAGVVTWAFIWSVKSRQFDDLEGPAHRILYEESNAVKRGSDSGEE